ncbi:MAG TPA: hypothetical protein VK550_03020 [Polyangiaceae bacterium]|nr:hypothetical protein [Polyangiaceae bacterium]
MGRVRLKTVVLAVVLGAPHTARASAASRLVYSRTPGAARCPDERGFRAAVAERLGYDPFFPWAEQTVSVDLFEEKGSLRAKLALIDRDGIVRGTRELKGATRDCEELLASLALATSITLDPMAVQSGGAAPTAVHRASDDSAASVPPPSSSSPLAAPAVVNEQAPTVDRAPAEQARTDGPGQTIASLHGGPVLAFGETPNASVGGRIGGQLRRGPWALAGELRGDLPTSTSSGPGGNAHVGVLGAAVLPCIIEGVWAACGIVYVGSMQTRGSGVEVPLATSLFFAAAGARAELSIPVVRSVDLRVHVDGMKTLTLSHLYLREREVWQTPPFWAAFGISAAISFP